MEFGYRSVKAAAGLLALFLPAMTPAAQDRGRDWDRDRDRDRYNDRVTRLDPGTMIPAIWNRLQ